MSSFLTDRKGWRKTCWSWVHRRDYGTLGSLVASEGIRVAMTSDASRVSLCPGTVVAQRFRLERLLGQGGMGSVWVAWHMTLHIEVAIKFIDSVIGAREEMLSRFAQEATSAAKIKSPHVVSIIDYGTDENSHPYIAMELLTGEELSIRVEREGQLPLRDVARIVMQACKGLTKAHAAGVVHRDLKPENVFLCEEEDGFMVKILDFGIAKAESPIGGFSHKTGTGQLLGTPTYMSPEQALGRTRIDARSDLYSLAIVAYRCLTGRVPFEFEGLGELIVAISTREPPLPSTFRPDLPPSLDDWFRKATHKEPSQRFASAKEMAEGFAFACNLSVNLTGGEHGTLSTKQFTSTGTYPRTPSIGTGATQSINAQDTRTLVGSTASSNQIYPSFVSKKRAGLYITLAALALGLAAFGGWKFKRSSSTTVASPAREVASAPSPPRASAVSSATPVGQAPPAPSSATSASMPAPTPLTTKATSQIAPGELFAVPAGRGSLHRGGKAAASALPLPSAVGSSGKGIKGERIEKADKTEPAAASATSASPPQPSVVPPPLPPPAASQQPPKTDYGL